MLTDLTSHPNGNQAVRSEGSLRTLSAAERALALGRMYTLLGQIYRYGLTANLLPLVQEIDLLAEVMPTPIDLSQAAAAHQTLFGFNVFPFESAFLEAEGMLGGAIADGVLQSYRRIGYSSSPDAVGADQLGEELMALAHLCLAESDAWLEERAGIARRMQSEQRRFLQQHILRWIFPCTLAVDAQENLFYSTVASLTVDLLASHIADLTDAKASSTQFSLPTTPNILADEKTSLADIVNLLLTPSLSGLFLSRDLLQKWGRRYRLPSGFGGRKLLLNNLIRSAIQFDAVDLLLDTLSKSVTGAISGYGAYQQEMPMLAPFIEPWRLRCKSTLQLLEQIKEQVDLGKQ